MEESSSSKSAKLSGWKKILIGIVCLLLLGQVLKNCDNNAVQNVAGSSDSSSISDSPKIKSASEINELVKGLKASKDDFKQTTFYTDPNSTEYVDRNEIALYLGRKDDQLYPRLKIQYGGDDWVFIEAYHFVIDGKNRTIRPTENVVRDNKAGMVWEYIDQSPSPEDLRILREISHSKVAKMRYQGKENVSDRVISSKEKKSLKRILEILSSYEAK